MTKLSKLLFTVSILTLGACSSSEETIAPSVEQDQVPDVTNLEYASGQVTCESVLDTQVPTVLSLVQKMFPAFTKLEEEPVRNDFVVGHLQTHSDVGSRVVDISTERIENLDESSRFFGMGPDWRVISTLMTYPNPDDSAEFNVFVPKSTCVPGASEYPFGQQACQAYAVTTIQVGARRMKLESDVGGYVSFATYSEDKILRYGELNASEKQRFLELAVNTGGLRDDTEVLRVSKSLALRDFNRNNVIESEVTFESRPYTPSGSGYLPSIREYGQGSQARILDGFIPQNSGNLAFNPDIGFDGSDQRCSALNVSTGQGFSSSYDDASGDMRLSGDYTIDCPTALFADGRYICEGETSVTGDCIDTDGDGYGWNGVESCRIADGENTNSGGQNSNSVCIDTDGDGYGWDGSATCVPSSENSSVETLECVDSDGDGYGWDGVRTCFPN